LKSSTSGHSSVAFLSQRGSKRVNAEGGGRGRAHNEDEEDGGEETQVLVVV
jgi:hypothetical protein